MALVNVDTGGPVITGVDKSSRWYRRSPEDTLPDLFLNWERSGLIETVCNELGGKTSLKLFEAADHSFHVPARSGRKDADVMNEALDAISGWFDTIGAR